MFSLPLACFAQQERSGDLRGFGDYGMVTHGIFALLPMEMPCRYIILDLEYES